MAKSKFSIMMNYHKTMQQATALDRLATELAGCLNSNTDSRNQVSAYWKGDNAQRYLRKIDVNNEDIRKIHKNVVDTSNAIKKIAKRTYETEMQTLLISQKRTYH